MSERYDPEYVDGGEKELIEQLDDVDTEALGRPSPRRQNELRGAAREYLKNRVTKMDIRVDAEELERVERQAEKERLRYNKLTKSVLHNYVTGQLVERHEKAG